MLISHTHKFIFIHNPRTGGTSIRKALGPYLASEDIRGSYYYPYYFHSTAYEIRKIVGERVWRNYFKFVFVRNIWDKLVSQYSYFSQTTEMDKLFPDFKEKFNNIYKDFNEWCEAFAVNSKKKNIFGLLLWEKFYFKRRGKRKFKDFEAWRKKTPLEWFSNARFVTDRSGKVIVDFIGRFEKFEQDFKNICECLKICVPIFHLNRANHKDYRTVYNEKTKKIVEKMFIKDIEMFNYTF